MGSEFQPRPSPIFSQKRNMTVVHQDIKPCMQFYYFYEYYVEASA